MKKIKKTALILFLLLISLPALGQIQRNMWVDKELMIKKYDYSNAYLNNMGSKLTEKCYQDSNMFLRFSFQTAAFYQNSSIDPEWNYNDKYHYIAVPVLYGKGTKNLSFYVSFMAQNAKKDMVDARKRYMRESQIGHWGNFEISKIQYETEHFYLKFGRDYFMPGMYFHEGLLFSKDQFPYDQIHLAYRNKVLELSSYYLRLNDMHKDGNRYLRHLNGHRLSINLFDKGYIALNEYILYQGVQRPINPALFNPMMIYYLYQRNDRIGGTNSMMGLDFFYHIGRFFIHGEFIMDDFMTERQVYSDLEPNKFGFNTTIGIKDILPGLHGNVNYTRIANRVYATGNPSDAIAFVEYLVHENLPIGHQMGSNLWEVKSNISYQKKKYLGEIDFVYRCYGDDVIYSPYNRDHYQGHTGSEQLEPDAEWNEPFPYVSDGGPANVFWGFKTKHYWQIFDYLGLNFRASYWFEKGLLSSHFNFACGVYFNISSINENKKIRS